MRRGLKDTECHLPVVRGEVTASHSQWEESRRTVLRKEFLHEFWHTEAEIHRSWKTLRICVNLANNLYAKKKQRQSLKKV